MENYNPITDNQGTTWFYCSTRFKRVVLTTPICNGLYLTRSSAKGLI